MKNDDKLTTSLKKVPKTTSVRCCFSGGMWIIELILTKIDDRNQIINTVNDSVRDLFKEPKLQTVWKIFLYEESHNRFFIDGTLHTKEISYEGGIRTTYLEEGDCFVKLTEYDGEILEMANYNSRVLIAKEAKDESEQAILPYKQSSNYLWLEAHGGYYGLEKSDGNVKQNGDIIEIYLKEAEQSSIM